MSGFSQAVINDLKTVMTTAWTNVVGDSRLTANRIFLSQSLTRMNYEDAQQDGTLSSPFGIIYPKASLDAADTPVHWLSLRHDVVLIFVMLTSDVYFQVNPTDPTEGYNIVGPMGSLVEACRQQLILFKGSFKVYIQMPSSNLDQHFMANTSFYALMDGKYAGHISASILTADTYSPSGQ